MSQHADQLPRLDHRLRRMTGRDPDEAHRAATPLELLFDLTFVVAFSQAGTQAAHLLTEGHTAAALGGLAFAVFAICWAWINYTWLASAYDNDDIFFRIATLVEMVGVLVLALGLPPVFHSIDAGEPLDNAVAVSGYVVMRVATIALWLRAARDDPAHRRAALRYVLMIGIAQLGWVAQIFLDPPLPISAAIWTLLVLIELAGPIVAERRDGGTPWHPHHIAERYGLLVIITLGEVVLGTVLAISAIVDEQGWSGEAVLVAYAGTALAFGLWWVYFTLPSGAVLDRHRERGFVWGYGHIVIFGAIAAAGAGLHVAANVIEGVANVDTVSALLCVVVPVAVFDVALFVLSSLLLHAVGAVQVALVSGSLLVLGASVWAAALGASLGWALFLASFAPIVLIVGSETVGRRHEVEALSRALA